MGNTYSDMKVQGATANKIAECLADKGLLPPTDPAHPYEHFVVDTSADKEGLITVIGRRESESIRAGFGNDIAVTPDIEATGLAAKKMRIKASDCISKVTGLSP